MTCRCNPAHRWNFRGNGDLHRSTIMKPMLPLLPIKRSAMQDIEDYKVSSFLEKLKTNKSGTYLCTQYKTLTFSYYYNLIYYNKINLIAHVNSLQLKRSDDNNLCILVIKIFE